MKILMNYDIDTNGYTYEVWTYMQIQYDMIRKWLQQTLKNRIWGHNDINTSIFMYVIYVILVKTRNCEDMFF